MTSLLVFGANGQLARSIAQAAEEVSIECERVGRDRLDLLAGTNLDERLDAVLAGKSSSRLVINAAAYTQVDRAESEQAQAYQLNTTAAGAISSACERAGLPIVHISTDFVFSGPRNTPWSETDTTAPLGVYGTTKLAGETAVARANPRHLIIRTAWLLSEFPGNFLTTMLRLGTQRTSLSVVNDQVGSPTSTHELARTLVSLAQMSEDDCPPWGVYHFAGPDTMSWAELARRIFQRAGLDTPVEDIVAADYGAPAPRPAFSALDSGKLQTATGLSHRPLAVVLDEILQRRD